VKIEISKDDIVEATTDDRGRIYLGTEYANRSVEVAILSDE
jgi:hypothetical protein